MIASIPRDVWIGVVTLIVAVGYWLIADQIPISPLDGAVNAAAMPKMLATALCVLAVILIVRSVAIEWIARRAATDAAAVPVDVGAADKAKSSTDWRAHGRAIGMLLIGMGYLLILPHIGYLVAVGILVLVTSIYMDARPSLNSVLVAAGLAVGFYLLFVVVLGIPLPPGIWPSLLR